MSPSRAHTGQDMDGGRWSRFGWVVALSLALVAHWIGFVSSGGPVSQEAVIPARGLLVVQELGPGTIRRASAVGSVPWSEPDLFAEVHPRGFTGAIWQSTNSPGYRYPEWEEPALWLQATPERFGRLNPDAMTPDTTLVVADGKPVPETPDPAVAPQEVRSGSTLVRRGGVNRLELMSSVVLPVVSALDLVGETVVEVLVNEEGRTVSARMKSSSASKEADAQGLALARSARYRPWGERRPVEGLVSGEWVFRWQVTGGSQP